MDSIYWILIFVFIIAISLLIRYMCAADAKSGGQAIKKGGSFLKDMYEKYLNKQFFTLRDAPELKNFVAHDNSTNKDRAKDFLFTPVSIYSMSSPHHTKFIIDKMRICLSAEHNSPADLSKLVITDATACVGGDSISFARTFAHVNAVEIDHNNFKALRHNVKLYNLESKFTLLNKDYTAVMDELKQDVVYIDPPWGGLEYASREAEIKLGALTLAEVVRKIKEPVFIKLPLHFDVPKFSAETGRRIHSFVYRKLLVLYVAV